MEVEFVNLGDTVEYAQYKNLENACLFDYSFSDVSERESSESRKHRQAGERDGRTLPSRTGKAEASVKNS